MKIGLKIPMLWDPSRPDPYHQVYTLCALAEEQGFDFVSLSHHSFTEDNRTSAPFMMLAAIAARTTKLRLASAVFLLPLHHPVAVAEQLATLDQISNGRAILGAGVGYRPYEYSGFGVDFHKRGALADESLRILRQAWSTGELGYEGAFYSIPQLPLVPMPVQPGGPPIWIGGTSPAALARAARLGDGWISDMLSPTSTLADRASTYRQACADEGRRPHVTITRAMWLGATSDDQMLWSASAQATRNNYANVGYDMTSGQGSRDDGGTVLAPELETAAIIGTPDECIEKLSLLKTETGCDALLVNLEALERFELIRDTIRLAGETIIPQFERAKIARPG